MTRDNWYIHKILEKVRNKANSRHDDMQWWVWIVGFLIVLFLCVRW